MAESFRLHLLHHMPALGSPAEMWRSVAGLQCSQLPPFPPPPDQFSSPAVFRKTKVLAEQQLE